MSKIKAIIFDLEGVVVDSEPIWSHVNATLVARHSNVPYSDEQTKHLLMGRSVVEGVRIMKYQYGIEGEDYELAAERKQIFGELIAGELKFVPGFLEFHKKIKDNYALAAGTSAEKKFLFRFDAALHLTEYFGRHIYSIEDIGFVSKPNPDIFLHAARMIKQDPADCLVIEDAPNGVQAARAAGMHAVALTTSTTRDRLEVAGANKIVDNYSEINLASL